MQQQVSFGSNGLTLTGVLHLQDDMQPGEKRPAIMVLHGFGGNKNPKVPVGSYEWDGNKGEGDAGAPNNSALCSP